jgi:putative drug exporter of the RND superfamily
LQSTQDSQSLDSTVKGLHDALATANQAMQSAGLDQPGGLQDRLATLQHGADALAEGSRRLADGVQQLVDQTRQMGAGLSDASGFLMAMKYDAGRPSMSGFYLPPQVLTQDDFKKAAAAFVSPDGHSARYFVQNQLNPFSTAAMDEVNAITDAARGAQPNTALADAKISMAGFSAGLRDTRDYYHNDLHFFIIATIIIVLLILVVLLRAIVAALYLIASVLLSYLSALGIGVIVFQLILGQQLHWSVPGLAFILLVAVGADYNLLLISRIRDESAPGLRLGVIRTVGSTGGVITSAGLIFAASMFGLMFASVTTMVQVGFVIGMGILLDTFLVRTITVPAMAVVAGQANWWPYHRLLSWGWRPRRGAKHRHAMSDTASRTEHAGVAAGPTVTERQPDRRDEDEHLRNSAAQPDSVKEAPAFPSEAEVSIQDADAVAHSSPV